MTYDAALQICTVHGLPEQEEAVYHAMLEVLSAADAARPFNTFPLAMQFVSDGIASQLEDEPALAREGRLVAVIDEITTILRMLVTAKCVLAGTIAESSA